MNTRLQVEHPVTEMITGLDLVEWQLRVSSGQPLPMTQEQVFTHIRNRPHAGGCAVEARLYAENPSNDFLPATGKIVHLRTPVDGHEEEVRADCGVRTGDVITTFYDPMIGKLIVHDSTREKAIRKLERALRDFQVCPSPFALASSHSCRSLVSQTTSTSSFRSCAIPASTLPNPPPPSSTSTWATS
jgi:3-methylcrotonyl-CoA carboxylase alpha subunit